MIRISVAALLVASLLSSCASRGPSSPRIATTLANPSTLRIASWNMEFLAEKNMSGCHPRQDADYAQMKAVAGALDADVIAFEEVESPAAATRVFDPARYTIVMEQRAGNPGGSCGKDALNQQFIRQAVGFAVRKNLAFTRSADVTDLQVGNPNLRSGVDITVTPRAGRPIRLLAVHLKSGCFQGDSGPACPQLLQQIPVVARWIDAAALGPTRFAVLGDWNRRLALPGDKFWAAIDDKSPPDDDLTLTDADTTPRCDPRFHDFIDHIVLDKRAGADLKGFSETTFAPGQHPSDHCPISVAIIQ